VKRIANVRFEQLRDYSGKSEADATNWRKAEPMRQNDGKHSRCGKLAESGTNAANWRKAEPMRQTGGKHSQCGKMTESEADAAK